MTNLPTDSLSTYLFTDWLTELKDKQGEEMLQPCTMYSSLFIYFSFFVIHQQTFTYSFFTIIFTIASYMLVRFTLSLQGDTYVF